MFSKISVKLVGIALAVVLAISSSLFAAAGDGKKVGVLWVHKSGMAQRVLDGMQQTLTKSAPGISVEVIKDIESDDAALPVYEKWQKEKDAIVFLRSDGAKFLMAHPSDIPAFIGACNNPEKLGLIKNMKKPEGNVTGVTYYLPAEYKMKLFKKVLPGMKKVALIVQEGHPSSPIEQAEVKQFCSQNSITYADAVCKNKDDLKAKVEKLLGSVDVFILGNQNLLIDNSAVVLEVCGDTPIVSLTEKPVEKKSALIAMAADDIMLGNKLGMSVIDVLVNGKAVSEVPVKIDEQPNILICVELMKKWGVKPPMDIIKVARLIK